MEKTAAENSVVDLDGAVNRLFDIALGIKEQRDELLHAAKAVIATRGGTMALSANDKRTIALRNAITKASS